jgi:signal transduction histidine kinase
VENAATFSPAGSPVTVKGTIRDGCYRIEVCDQGPGLSAGERARIGAFTQFGRQQKEQQGLGLGLAIAQSTARLAGGSLELEPGADGSPAAGSAEAGRGLRVVFSLPLAR